MPPRVKHPPGRPSVEPTEMRQVQGEDAILRAWHAEVCKRGEAVDPNDELHWRSVWIGFAIAKGMEPARAARIYDRKAAPFEVRRENA